MPVGMEKKLSVFWRKLLLKDLLYTLCQLGPRDCIGERVLDLDFAR